MESPRLDDGVTLLDVTGAPLLEVVVRLFRVVRSAGRLGTHMRARKRITWGAKKRHKTFTKYADDDCGNGRRVHYWMGTGAGACIGKERGRKRTIRR